MKPETLSLEQFQASKGIPFSEQIILINNPQIYNGFDSVFEPPGLRNLPHRGIGRLLRPLGFKFPVPIRIPAGSSNLFFGLHERSYDQINKDLEALFKKVAQCPDRQFKIAMGKTDHLVDESFLRSMPNNIETVWVNNVDVKDQRIQYLPMGRDFRNMEVIEDFSPQPRKSTLCYCNFSLNTHPVRSSIHNLLKCKNFIRFEHMGEFLEYPVTRQEYLERLSCSNFAICPRGNALDTFRLWDCLYLGTIPIVVREAVFHEQLNDLPILFLDSVEEFNNLTESFLTDSYEKMLKKPYNFSKLKIGSWLN